MITKHTEDCIVINGSIMNLVLIIEIHTVIQSKYNDLKKCIKRLHLHISWTISHSWKRLEPSRSWQTAMSLMTVVLGWFIRLHTLVRWEFETEIEPYGMLGSVEADCKKYTIWTKFFTLIILGGRRGTWTGSKYINIGADILFCWLSSSYLCNLA